MEQKELNFEETLAKLEAIVSKLESPELSLDEALKVFEEGIQLSRACAQKLEEAELRVQKLSRIDGEIFAAEPFDPLSPE